MAADIYSATQTYLSSYLTLQSQAFPGGIYLGQIPEDHSGQYPCLTINDLGFATEWTFEAGFIDRGALRIDSYGIGASVTRILGDFVKSAFANPNTWGSVTMPGNQYVMRFERRRFQLLPEQFRGPDGSLLFKHEAEFDVDVVGNY